MPNWCSQNSVLRGPKDSIARFCETVNSVLVKPDVRPNGFGKFWLGNLCVAFGYDYDTLDEAGARLRGNFDPDPYVPACMIHPEPEEKRIVPETVDEQTSSIGFSIVSAWGQSDWWNDMIAEKFPDCEYAWKATDEFGNFHECHNPHVLNVPRYEIEQYGDPWGEMGFNRGEEEAAAAFVNRLTRKRKDRVTAEDFLKGEDAVISKLLEYNDKHEDTEIVVRVWEEV